MSILHTGTQFFTHGQDYVRLKIKVFVVYLNKMNNFSQHSITTSLFTRYDEFSCLENRISPLRISSNGEEFWNTVLDKVVHLVEVANKHCPKMSPNVYLGVENDAETPVLFSKVLYLI